MGASMDASTGAEATIDEAGVIKTAVQVRNIQYS